jgi:hypothetical protein
METPPAWIRASSKAFPAALLKFAPEKVTEEPRTSPFTSMMTAFVVDAPTSIPAYNLPVFNIILSSPDLNNS